MHKERLLRLADLLENLPQGKPYFNMAWWYRCGTSACAAGQACLDPWFNRRGLKLDVKDIPHEISPPVYKGHSGWAAVHAFFDLNKGQARRLFDQHWYPGFRPSRQAVAKRIREFVANKEAQGS